MSWQRVSIVDSHTGGEPTRVVVAGGPDLGAASLRERRELFRSRHDTFRSAVVNEPRGSDVLVGALLCKPVDASCAAGVIFFNNVGVLNMCGHGTIGLGVTLAHLGRIQPGRHRLETPVGEVSITLEDAHHVCIDNVASYRLAKQVPVDVPGLGVFRGDIAWGGNWFFLVYEHQETLTLANLDRLNDVSRRIKQALIDQKITGAEGAEIDHVELFGPPTVAGAQSRNFVLCPGGAYDRSPCGTGTSAKLACLVADGKLAEGETYVQESIIGSVFEGSVRIVNGEVRPRIRGAAYITAETTLLLDPKDPFVMGIRA
ncbi:MAG: proline racemase family protein [Gemmataceae bacterium]